MKTTIPAPDPNTRKPKFKPPPLACDAHCHVFGPGSRFPYAEDAAYIPPDSPFEDLQRLHKTLGIERTVIVEETYAEAEFQRLHDGGIRGVRFNFVKHLGGRPDMAFFQRTVDRVKEMGWHLILHLDATDLVEFDALFKRIPVPVVIDHMGRVSAKEGLEQRPFKVLLEAMKRENCWVKICGAERVSSNGPPFTDAVPFARKLIEAAPDRVLWGTDWPHPNVKWMPNDGDLLDLFAQMAPEAALQRMILVDNPARLYGF